jgi:hypothetical protein
MKNLIILILLFCVFFQVSGQEFKAQSSLPRIEQDGFYRIILTPELSPYINNAYSNIRIHDGSNREVPYFIKAEEAKTSTVTFEEYRIHDKIRIKDSCSLVILSNPENTTINNISLVIKNAEVTKDAILSGSDDAETWYALKESFVLSNINNANETAEVKIVDFPLSNYKYYRIWINDQASEPLNILKAGYYHTTSEDAKYFIVPKPLSVQTNDNKKKTTQVNISFDTLRFIDKITWNVSGSPYYLRNATLYASRDYINKKGKTEKHLEHLESFQLNSRQENVLFLSPVKVKELVMIVENEDNPALTISDVNGHQLSQYVVTWLKKGNDYKLKFGDEAMREPVYDLAFFQDSIRSAPVVLQAGKVTSLEKTQTIETPSLFNTKSIIWAAIIVIIILLGAMSMKLIRETNAAGKGS